jgi:phosphatidylinositol glycan class Z
MFGIKKAILWRKLGWMAISFAVLSAGIVMADTVFYSKRRNEASALSSLHQDALYPLDYSSLVVTPFNALAYNSKISNLKDHGLHPRWTHAVVNMLIMYGPLTLATYLLMATKLLNSVGYTSKGRTLVEGDGLIVSAGAVLFGLGLLSIAPHQEPRFLLPLLVPLVLLGAKPIRRFPTTGACVWIFFNLILLILFGVLHQGGVTKALLAVGSVTTWGRQKQPTSWIYMRTYMPPTFLTRLPRNAAGHPKTCRGHNEQGVCDQVSFNVFGTRLDDACQKEQVHILDLKGSSLEKLNEVIRTELACSNRLRGSDGNTFLYLVAPFVEQDGEDHYSGFSLSPSGREGQFQLSNKSYKWNLVDSYGPHLTTEDFPPFRGSFAEFYNMLALNVYTISCAETI